MNHRISPVILSIKEYGKQEGMKHGKENSLPLVYLLGHQITWGYEREDIYPHQKEAFALSYIEGYEQGLATVSP
jgi:hypothetical protein